MKNAFALLCMLAGCSSNTDTASLYARFMPGRSVEPQMNAAFLANADAGAPAFIANVEKRPEGIALFVRQTRSGADGVSTWIAADGTQIMLQNGVLVGTRGLGGDVLASKVDESSSLIHALRPGHATRLMTLLDGDTHAVTRSFKCRITTGAIDPVIIGDKTVPARTVTEECKSTDEHFYNFYWVTSSGEIIQSSQWAGSFTGKISTRVTPNNKR